jgi:hypothetical protein
MLSLFIFIGIGGGFPGGDSLENVFLTRGQDKDYQEELEKHEHELDGHDYL